MLKFSIHFVVFISLINSSSLSREKRFLIFPRANPTRHQFIAGIGIPVDIEQGSMTIGYVIKGQYYLPYNESQLKPTRLERDVDEYGQRYETYDVEAKVKSVVEDFPQREDEDDAVRWVIYRTLETVLNTKGMDGKQCVLRAICEASQLPFTHESGLLSEIFHVLLVPSSSSTSTGSRNEYMAAEAIGRSEVNCEELFSRCTFSLMNIFTQIY